MLESTKLNANSEVIPTYLNEDPFRGKRSRGLPTWPRRTATASFNLRQAVHLNGAEILNNS